MIALIIIGTILFIILVNTVRNTSIRPDFTLTGHSKSRIPEAPRMRPAHRPYKKAMTKARRDQRQCTSFYIDGKGRQIPLRGLRLWWVELKMAFRQLAFSSFWLKHKALHTAMPLTPKGVEWEAAQAIDVSTAPAASYDGQMVRDTTSARLYRSNGTSFLPVSNSQTSTFVVAATDSINKSNADYVCDGVNDDVQIQTAIEAADAAGGGTVQLLEGNFAIGMTIESADLSNVILKGCGPNTILKMKNQITSNVTQTELIAQPVIHVADGSLFRIGQFVALRDADHEFGVSSIIINIVGNTITLDRNLQWQLTLASNPKCMDSGPVIGIHGVPLTAASAITISDMTIDSNKAGFATWTAYPCAYSIGIGTYPAMNRMEIKNCYIINCYNPGVAFTTASRFNVHDNLIEHCGVEAAEPAIYCEGSCGQMMVVNNDILTCGGGFAGGDLVRGIISGNNIYCDIGATAPSNGVSVTDTAQNVVIFGNVIRGCLKGIFVSGAVKDIAVIGNTINGTYSRGIEVSTGALKVLVQGNTITEARIGGMWIVAATQISIIGNIIRDCNTVDTAGVNGDAVQLGYGGDAATDIIFKDNLISNAGTGNIRYGIVLGNVNRLSISGNKIITPETGPISYGTVLEATPRPTQSLQCFLAYATNNVLGASFNGSFSATTQPDAISGRNLVVEKVGATAAGGVVTVTGLDQFGNAVSDTYTFVGGAEVKVLTKIFSSINVTGIVISALTAGDTIQVGLGNKLGLDHKLFTGAVRRVFKSGVGDIAGLFTEDATYHGVTMPANIAANETYQITSLDCLA